MEYLLSLTDFFIHIDIHLAEFVAQYDTWVYLILFLVIFCETGLVVTPFLPGDTLLFIAGTLAALPTNNINIVVMTSLIIIAAIMGDSVNFEIGKKLGYKLFSNPNSKIFKQSYLKKTHDFYERFGGKTIILARFIPLVRTFAPFVGGMGRMKYKRFIFYNVTGAIIWVSIFCFSGYLVGNLSWVQRNLKFLILMITIVTVMPAIFEFFRQKLQYQRVSNK